METCRGSATKRVLQSAFAAIIACSLVEFGPIAAYATEPAGEAPAASADAQAEEPLVSDAADVDEEGSLSGEGEQNDNALPADEAFVSDAARISAPSLFSAVELIAGDFKVTGDDLAEGVDFSFDAGALTVKTSKQMTVSMADSASIPTSHRIVVQGDAKLELKDVSIESADSAALVVENGATDLVLEGTNKLTSGSGHAGLELAGAARLTVSGDGRLEATGGYEGAGIGSAGRSRGMGSVTIESGTIVANGGTGGAGIGSGSGSWFGEVVLSGGDVTASSAWGGAGVGSGNSGSVDTVSVTGGSIRARAGDGGAGIGMGNAGRVTDISLSGGSVNATGGLAGGNPGGAGIGSGSDPKSAPNITISGGSIFAVGRNQVPINADAVITGGSFAVGSIDDNTVYGIAPVGYCVVEAGSVAGFPCEVKGVGDFVIDGGKRGQDYEYADGVLTVINNSHLTVRMWEGVASTSERIVVDAPHVRLELQGVVVATDKAAVSVLREGLTLAVEQVNELVSGDGHAGIELSGDASLSIRGWGSLKAEGGAGGAGIGSGEGVRAGAVELRDGAIHAIGGLDAEGIGAGRNGAIEAVSVTGGFIEAEGKGGSAAIASCAAIAGGCFADGDADAVYGIAPQPGYRILANTDPATRNDYPWKVSLIPDIVVEGEDLVEGVDYTSSPYDGIVVLSSKPMTMTMREGVSTTIQPITVEEGIDAHLTFAGVDIDSMGVYSSGLLVLGSLDLTLAAETENKITSSFLSPAICLQGKASLRISGEGSLTAISGRWGFAGISSSEKDGGEVAIEGGTVTAIGGEGAEGIGDSRYGTLASISISGGKVKAEAGSGAQRAINENAVITGGLFGDQNAEHNTVYGVAVAEGYAVGDNLDTDTAGEYPVGVGAETALSLSLREVAVYDGNPLEANDFELTASGTPLNELAASRVLFGYRASGSQEAFSDGFPVDAGSYEIRAGLISNTYIEGASERSAGGYATAAVGKALVVSGAATVDVAIAKVPAFELASAAKFDAASLGSTVQIDLAALPGFPVMDAAPSFAVEQAPWHGLSSASVDGTGVLSLEGSGEAGTPADEVVVRVSGTGNFEGGVVRVSVSYPEGSVPEPLPDDPEPLPDDPKPLPDDPEPLPDDPKPLPDGSQGKDPASSPGADSVLAAVGDSLAPCSLSAIVLVALASAALGALALRRRRDFADR